MTDQLIQIFTSWRFANALLALYPLLSLVIDEKDWALARLIMSTTNGVQLDDGANHQLTITQAMINSFNAYTASEEQKFQ